MLFRVGKNGQNREGQIGFLETDFEKLASEVQAVHEKYNYPKAEQPLKVAQTNKGSMYSQQNQQRIGFLEGNGPSPLEKPATPVTPTPTAKMAQSFDPENRLHNGKSVARLSSSGNVGDSISDNGGPTKYIKSQSQPSIWDTDKLQRLVQETDQRTLTRMEREATVEARKTLRQSSLDNLTEMLQNTDQRKAAQVMPAGDQTVSEAQSRFTKVSRNISIFDCVGNQQGEADFERLPEKTLGEKVSERRRAEASQVDDSWRLGGRVESSKGAVDRLFDALVNASQNKTEGK